MGEGPRLTLKEQIEVACSILFIVSAIIAVGGSFLVYAIIGDYFWRTASLGIGGVVVSLIVFKLVYDCKQ